MLACAAGGLADRNGGEEFRQLQEIWSLVYRSDLVIAQALEQARGQELLPAAAQFCRFLEAQRAGAPGTDASNDEPLMVRLLISTGEVSGDLQGSLLITALKREAARRGLELDLLALGGADAGSGR